MDWQVFVSGSGLQGYNLEIRDINQLFVTEFIPWYEPVSVY
jgi:hypothetical protein